MSICRSPPKWDKITRINARSYISLERERRNFVIDPDIEEIILNYININNPEPQPYEAEPYEAEPYEAEPDEAEPDEAEPDELVYINNIIIHNNIDELPSINIIYIYRNIVINE